MSQPAKLSDVGIDTGGAVSMAFTRDAAELLSLLSDAERDQLQLHRRSLHERWPAVAPPTAVGPGVGGTAFDSGNTFPQLYDPIGRSFTMGARVRF